MKYEYKKTCFTVGLFFKTKTMKKIIYLILFAGFFSACNQSLNEDKVEEFIVTHFAEKIGGEDAIDKLKEDAGDSILMYSLSNGWIGRPEWVSDHSKIKAEWFYEDSIIAEVKNIEVFGNVASVYGLSLIHISEPTRPY